MNLNGRISTGLTVAAIALAMGIHMGGTRSFISVDILTTMLSLAALGVVADTNILKAIFAGCLISSLLSMCTMVLDYSTFFYHSRHLADLTQIILYYGLWIRYQRYGHIHLLPACIAVLMSFFFLLGISSEHYGSLFIDIIDTVSVLVIAHDYFKKQVAQI